MSPVSEVTDQSNGCVCTVAAIAVFTVGGAMWPNGPPAGSAIHTPDVIGAADQLPIA
jgi:hypothetical protein